VCWMGGKAVLFLLDGGGAVLFLYDAVWCNFLTSSRPALSGIAWMFFPTRSVLLISVMAGLCVTGRDNQPF
jgi:hypothetical protein